MDVVEIKGCTLLAGSPLPVGDSTITSDDILAPSLENELDPLNGLLPF